jgi:hypothetical protein
VLSEHKGISFRSYIKSTVPLPFEPDYEYVGEATPVNVMKKLHFYNIALSKALSEIRKKNVRHNLSVEEERSFQTATKCCFCNKDLGNDRVRDHDHFTGKYFGAAHNKCNLSVKDSKPVIPVFFHNSNFDLKQLIGAYEELRGDLFKDVTCIPINMENFKCVRFGNLIIYDSFAHVSCSLDKNIKNLPEEKKIMLRQIASSRCYFKRKL